MTPRETTLADSMAIEILKGNRVDAYALADLLIEERDDGARGMAEAARETRNHPVAGDGWSVYQWPEFQAFCKRAGILWDLRTTSMTFTIEEGTFPRVTQTYAMANVEVPAVIDTTRSHVPAVDPATTMKARRM